jgi:hypothetical protein
MAFQCNLFPGYCKFKGVFPGTLRRVYIKLTVNAMVTDTNFTPVFLPPVDMMLPVNAFG